MKPRTNLILDVIIAIVFVVALVSGLPLWASLLAGGAPGAACWQAGHSPGCTASPGRP